MNNEHSIMNEIRLALAPNCTIFRANNGLAWVGNDYNKLPDGSVLIRNARPFQTGLPNGFSDLFGIQPVTVTEDMIGQTLGVFVAIECKAKSGRVSDQQSHFIDVIINKGGRAGIARSVDDAVNIIRNGGDK